MQLCKHYLVFNVKLNIAVSNLSYESLTANIIYRKPEYFGMTPIEDEYRIKGLPIHGRYKNTIVYKDSVVIDGIKHIYRD